MPSSHLTANAPLLLAILLVIDSLHFIFARLLLPYLPPGVSAFYVLSVATAEMAAFSLVRGRIRFAVFRHSPGFFLVVGLLVGASTNLNYAAVAFVDPGTASLLGQMSVLFGLGFGLLWLRDRLTSLETAGGLIAIAGVFIITFQPGDYLRLGSLMVLASALMYALHTAIVKRHGQDLDFADFFLFRLACTSGFLLLFAIGRGDLVWPGPRAWLMLVLVGTVDVVISRALFYLALRRLKMSVHTIILTLSPVVTVGWSLMLFREVPTPQEMAGGLAVIAGIMILTVSRARLARSVP